MNKELINIAKEIQGKKSDAIVCWKPKYRPDASYIPLSLKETETKWFRSRKLSNEVKRIWIYVIFQEKKQLCYIMKLIEYKGNLKHSADDINTIVDNSKLNHTYRVENLYQFKQPITLQELKKYEHQETKKKFHPSENISYVNSYPKLIKDIFDGKIQ